MKRPGRYDAQRAKTALARARIAVRYCMTAPPGTDHGRGFYDCVEMGDGDAVVAFIVGMAHERPEVAEAIRGQFSKVSARDIVNIL